MSGVHVLRLPEVADARVAAEAEAIFWESAATQHFAADDARAAYRELWFGRYLEHAPAEFFLAFGRDDGVIGYLAGSRVSDAPPLLGPEYYALFPPALIARFPAHLHVNVGAGLRGAGVGGALVMAFLTHCAASGISGVHAVTAAGSRAAAFFQRCGLDSRGRVNWRGRDLAFLAAGTSRAAS